jgi:DNA-binding transcriptional regulator YiaG
MQDASQDRLSALVAASGLSIAAFARLVVGRDERTVRRWLRGEIEVPDSAARWLGRVTVSATAGAVVVTVRR